MLNSPPKYRISFAGTDRQIEVSEGENLLQSAVRAGIRLTADCGGRGTCGKCGIKVLSGSFSDRSNGGVKTAGTESGISVLACMAEPLSDCVIKPAVISAAALRTGTDMPSASTSYPFNPAIRVLDVKLPPPSLEDPVPDMERVIRQLGREVPLRLDLSVLKTMPQLLRQNNWQARLVIREDELIACFPPESSCYTMAVDFGSSNMEAFLIDLTSGHQAARFSAENPQGCFGADIISRINHAARSPQGQAELQSKAVFAINSLAEGLCSIAGTDTNLIVEIAVCGNTAITHLLLGLPVAQLGMAPFVPASVAAMDVKAVEIGLNGFQGAYLHVMPGIGGFIGGDHVAALLATEELWSGQTAMLVDIGTNTEISLIHNGSIYSTSTASGPAFEGGHISAGMRAAQGAIEHISTAEEGFDLQVIGNTTPVGLCGSGVIDAVATLFCSGIIDKRGRMLPDNRFVINNGSQKAVSLAADVIFIQQDVRTVQLAKGAIRAGIDLILQEAGLSEQDIGCFIVAGAFGSYIDIENTIRIGMFPDLDIARFQQVGNAAGAGIKEIVISNEARMHAGAIAGQCRHLELGSRKGFQHAFMQRIGF